MAKKWLYGYAWDKYPIEEGETWQCGEHLLKCGSITEFGLTGLMQDNKVDMVYVDPPYNTGLINSFRTKAGLDTKQEFRLFIVDCLNAINTYCTGVAYMEMGSQNIEVLTKYIYNLGGFVLQQWDITYNKTKPCHLVRFTFDEVKASQDIMNESAHGMDDILTPQWAVQMEKSHYGVNSILDFCMGRGLVGQAGHKNGLKVYGMELNKRRLANLIEWYAKQGLSVEPKHNL